MLAWEFEDFTGAGSVHHLSVLCYNLQHSSVYSPEGLLFAMNLLHQFVVEGMSPQLVRSQNRQTVDSANRAFKITGTPEAHGVYAHPVQWTMTAWDVTAGGLAGYCERVQAWSRAVYQALKDSENCRVSHT